MTCFAIIGASRIFDGEAWHEDAALLIEDGFVADIVPSAQLPLGLRAAQIEGGILAPGFVDLQVNGGGGVMLNDHPTAETIETICRAHGTFGTTALLPTLITDTSAVTAAAIQAGREAVRRKVPGFLGLHLEGPHLSLARKGAHEPALIRLMGEADLKALIEAKRTLPVLLSTVAPESVPPEQIARLVQAGLHVSLGHSDADAAAVRARVEAGATLVTHLFNAMSQLGNREAGMVGAALESGALWAGLIADGIHVAPESIKIALRAKQGTARVFLVTDAMATIGTDMTHFSLNGREIRRENGRLTLADGTLAGADLDMAAAVRFMHQRIGQPLGEALRMASLYPAQAIDRAPEHGRLLPGSRADIVHLDDALHARKVWIGGASV